jgi:hypothetical protein
MDMRKPKPADPVWYRLDCDIVLQCRCGHNVRERIDAFAAKRNISHRLDLWQVVARLKCTACGRNDPSVDVIMPGY